MKNEHNDWGALIELLKAIHNLIGVVLLVLFIGFAARFLVFAFYDSEHPYVIVLSGFAVMLISSLLVIYGKASKRKPLVVFGVFCMFPYWCFPCYWNDLANRWLPSNHVGERLEYCNFNPSPEYEIMPGDYVEVPAGTNYSTFDSKHIKHSDVLKTKTILHMKSAGSGAFRVFGSTDSLGTIFIQAKDAKKISPPTPSGKAASSVP